MNIPRFRFTRWLVLPLIGGLLVTQTLRAEESVETLATFTGPNGCNPGSIHQDKHGNFFGTTHSGGKYDLGTVFELPLNMPLVTLISFDGHNGAHPLSGLTEGPDGTLYGTTSEGGSGGKGTVFSISPDRKNVKTLVALDGSNGAYPKSTVLLGRDGNLYGTTFSGGAAGKGVLFSVTPKGKFTPLITFNGSNGINPGGLSSDSKGNFYGTTYSGGQKNLGTVFRYDPDPQFVTLISFTGDNGAHPQAELCELSDGNFYGTTYDGGKKNLGEVFCLTQDGVLTIVVSFNGGNGSHPNSGLTEWADGYFYMERLWDRELIKASVVQWSGVNFCGTTSEGGDHGNGTVFRVTSGGALTTVISFTGTAGKQLGTVPNSLQPGNDGNLYGTTWTGGASDKGTVFRILLQVILPAGAGVGDGNSVCPPPLVSP